MKFILFICISLLASLFHAAAMPIDAIGDSSKTAKSEMVGQHSIHQHAKMMKSGHHQAEDNCPHNNGTCCLTLTMPLNHINSILLPLTDEVYASLSSPPPKIILETLYRPPKFFA